MALYLLIALCMPPVIMGWCWLHKDPIDFDNAEDRLLLIAGALMFPVTTAFILADLLYQIKLWRDKQ